MPDAMTDPLVGQIIDGRYHVLELVARGGMATVYRANDRRLGRDVALKIMNAAVAGDVNSQDFVSRFRREARTAARLTHPGMVRVYDQGTDGEHSYLTMEFVSGTTLRAVLKQSGTLTIGGSLVVAEKILDALGAAHRQGLVHRDVKPENVLIDDDGEPKIADFGIARAITEVTATSTGTLMGTVAYMAPELVQDGESDARTDVYSIGVLLYEMLTGRQPFTGESAIDIAHRHVTEDIPAPSTHVPWLPPELDLLIGELAARSPDARPEDAREALALIRRTRSMIDEPTLARRADPPSGAMPLANSDEQPTRVLIDPPTGSTVALPIGLGTKPQPTATTAGTPGADREGATTTTTTVATRGRGIGWWIGAVATSVAVLTAVFAWWFASYGPGAYTVVPGVAGLTAEAATEVLSESGLEARITSAFDDNVEAGLVVGTTPAADGQVASGGTVIIIVSKGARTTDVPALVGIAEVDALSRIASAAFPAPEILREYSDTIPAGEVIASTPEAGERVRYDTEITLVVSSGPEPIVIPNVVGKTEANAKAALDQFALDVNVVTGRTLDVAKGRVFKQDPKGGADGVRTQEITIYVSIGKPLVEVPFFIGMGLDQARNRAEDIGLKVEFDNEGCAGVVCSQSIDEGKKVEVGTTIFLGF